MNKDSPLFLSGGATPNCNKRKVKCSPLRPCKRITSCNECLQRKREYFITMCADFIRRNSINVFMTISWSTKDAELPWDYLKHVKRVSEIFSKLRSKYLRVIAVGTKEGAMHVHLVLPVEIAIRLARKVERIKFNIKPSVDIRPIDDPRGLMVYFYDENYIPTLKRTDRPKALRLLTGSRGIKYGYPDKKEWKKFEAFLKECVEASIDEIEKGGD